MKVVPDILVFFLISSSIFFTIRSAEAVDWCSLQENKDKLECKCSTDHNPVACQSIKISESYDATAADGFDEPRTTDTSSVKTIRRIASSSSISGVSSSAWRFLTSLVPPLSPLNTNKNQKRLSTNIRLQRQQKIKTSGSSTTVAENGARNKKSNKSRTSNRQKSFTATSNKDSSIKSSKSAKSKGSSIKSSKSAESKGSSIKSFKSSKSKSSSIKSSKCAESKSASIKTSKSAKSKGSSIKTSKSAKSKGSSIKSSISSKSKGSSIKTSKSSKSKSSSIKLSKSSKSKSSSFKSSKCAKSKGSSIKSAESKGFPVKSAKSKGSSIKSSKSSKSKSSSIKSTKSKSSSIKSAKSKGSSIKSSKSSKSKSPSIKSTKSKSSYIKSAKSKISSIKSSKSAKSKSPSIKSSKSAKSKGSFISKCLNKAHYGKSRKLGKGKGSKSNNGKGIKGGNSKGSKETYGKGSKEDNNGKVSEGVNSNRVKGKGNTWNYGKGSKPSKGGKGSFSNRRRRITSTQRSSSSSTLSSSLEGPHKYSIRCNPSAHVGYTVCGSLSCPFTTLIHEVSDLETAKHAVRCCSDSNLSSSENWIQDKCFAHSGHHIWSTSRDSEGNCLPTETTYSEAAEICDNLGARLCDIEELTHQCTSDSTERGCGYDQLLIWSNQWELKYETPSSAPTEATGQVRKPSLTSEPSYAPSWQHVDSLRSTFGYQSFGFLSLRSFDKNPHPERNHRSSRVIPNLSP